MHNGNIYYIKWIISFSDILDVQLNNISKHELQQSNTFGVTPNPNITLLRWTDFSGLCAHACYSEKPRAQCQTRSPLHIYFVLALTNIPSIALHTFKLLARPNVQTSRCCAIGLPNWCWPVECKYFPVSTCLNLTFSSRRQPLPDTVSTFQKSAELVSVSSPKQDTSWLPESGDLCSAWLWSHLPVPACFSLITKLFGIGALCDRGGIDH